MKRIKLLTPLALLAALSMNASAQDCAVAMESIKGKYEGGCDKGKANGQGKAYGYDSYEGEFKNGLPDGVGKYGWKNQDYYIGSMKKGLRDGKGEMHFYTTSGKDSIVVGYWKKDKYVGLYEKAYEVKSMSGRVNKVAIRLVEKGSDEVNFTVTGAVGGMYNITDIVPITGRFYSKSSQQMTNMSTMRMQQVEFPFRAIFTLSNGENFEILLNEKATYDINVDMMN